MILNTQDRSNIERLRGINDIEQHLQALATRASHLINEAHSQQEAAERATAELHSIAERLRAEIGEEERQARERIRADCHDVSEAINRMGAEKSKGFPWLARAIAEYHELCDLKVAELLMRKLHPARKAAARVRQLSKEKREFHRKFRITRDRIGYYERLFPWLTDYIGEDLDDLIKEAELESTRKDRDDDPVKHYVTDTEYLTLPPVQRNQLALDRYWMSRKQAWQVGRDYERYIGYLYESDGYEVTYQGIVEGLADLGRDLIAQRSGRIRVIQCKNWRKEKVIREKHVFQLYGTTIEYWLKNRRRLRSIQLELFSDTLDSDVVKPVFAATTTFSREAMEFANVLGVAVKTIPFDRDYPCIKCNVSRPTGERIYHLPMDQQYDTVVIEPSRGERYVQSVAHAEQLGFRRAYRWRPEASTGQ